MTVIFDCIDCDLKAVELSKVTRNKTCIRVLFLCACEWVLLFRCLNLLLSLFSIFTDYFFWYNVDMDLVWFSNEKTLNLVKSFEVLVVHSGEGFEFIVCGCAPVETLLRELILISVSYTQANVIVLFSSFDTAPEK